MRTATRWSAPDFIRWANKRPWPFSHEAGCKCCQSSGRYRENCACSDTWPGIYFTVLQLCTSLRKRANSGKLFHREQRWPKPAAKVFPAGYGNRVTNMFNLALNVWNGGIPTVFVHIAFWIQQQIFIWVTATESGKSKSSQSFFFNSFCFCRGRGYIGAFFQTVMLYNLMKVNAKFPQQPCVFICDCCKINKKFQSFVNVPGISIHFFRMSSIFIWNSFRMNENRLAAYFKIHALNFLM